MKKTRKDYATDLQYIHAYYLRNKKYIDENISYEWSLGKNQTPYEGFKELVLGQQEYTNPKTGEKYSVQEAIKRKMASKDMHKDWEAIDVYAHNFLKKIKSTKTLKEEIIKKTNEENVMTYERTLHKGTDKEVTQTITKLRENFNAYQVYFEGYYSVMGTNALVYRYNDVFIVEYRSPKLGTGATFDVIPEEEFKAKLGKEIIFLYYSKRSKY